MDARRFRIVLVLGCVVGLMVGCAPPDELIPIDTFEIPDEIEVTPDPTPVDLVDTQDPAPTEVTEMVGESGSLRFHLKFTNETGVDLDLHVVEPGGEEINYAQPLSSNKGELDVDCRCGYCPEGPSENIFWPDDVYFPGTYTYWINYYTGCDDYGSASTYTLYVIVDDEVVKTHQGTLAGFPTSHFEFVHESP